MPGWAGVLRPGTNSSMRIAFIDTETSGTEPHVHELWEAALVLEEDQQEADAWTYQARLSNPSVASPTALQIGGYYERGPGKWCASERNAPIPLRSRDTVAEWLARRTAGCRLASCNIAFDVRFVERLLIAQGRPPAWHYSPIDIKSLCYGAQPGTIGMKTDELIDAFGVRLDSIQARVFEVTQMDAEADRIRHTNLRHSALFDAYVARALYWRALAWTRTAATRGSVDEATLPGDLYG